MADAPPAAGRVVFAAAILGTIASALGLVAGTAYLITLGHSSAQIAPLRPSIAAAFVVHAVIGTLAVRWACSRIAARPAPRQRQDWSSLPSRVAIGSAMAFLVLASAAIVATGMADVSGDFVPHATMTWIILPALVHGATMVFALDELARSKLSRLPAPDPSSFRFHQRLKVRFLVLFAALPTLPVIGLGFALAHAVDEHEARAFAENVPAERGVLLDMHAGIPVVCLSVAAISLLLGWLAARSLFRPIAALTNAMERAASGDLAAKVQVASDDELGRAAVIFNEMTRGLSDREWLRENFGRYVSPEVAEALKSGRIGLEGEQRAVTVLFSDIRNFTTLAEKMPPPELLRFLNEYVDLMIDAVTRHGGHVDKIMGDGLMVVFGAPVDDASHAQSALRAAAAMRQALVGYNVARAQRLEEPLRMGIGIHSGPVITGNVGCASYKMEYTALGDTVNLASRIESLTKELGADLLVTEDTVAAAGSSFKATLVREVQVRGRLASVKVFAVEPA